MGGADIEVDSEVIIEVEGGAGAMAEDVGVDGPVGTGERSAKTYEGRDASQSATISYTTDG